MKILTVRNMALCLTSLLECWASQKTFWEKFSTMLINCIHFLNYWLQVWFQTKNSGKISWKLSMHWVNRAYSHRPWAIIWPKVLFLLNISCFPNAGIKHIDYLERPFTARYPCNWYWKTKTSSQTVVNAFEPRVSAILHLQEQTDRGTKLKNSQM